MAQCVSARYTGHFAQTVVAHPQDSGVIITCVGSLLVVGEWPLVGLSCRLILRRWGALCRIHKAPLKREKG